MTSLALIFGLAFLLSAQVLGISFNITFINFSNTEIENVIKEVKQKYEGKLKKKDDDDDEDEQNEVTNNRSNSKDPEIIKDNFEIHSYKSENGLESDENQIKIHANNGIFIKPEEIFHREFEKVDISMKHFYYIN